MHKEILIAYKIYNIFISLSLNINCLLNYFGLNFVTFFYKPLYLSQIALDENYLLSL